MNSPTTRSPRLRLLPLLLLGLLVAGCGGGGGGAPQSVHVVTNLNDDGPGSLRQAIAAAGPGQPIVFDPALAKGTIQLQSELDIDKAVVIGGLSGSGERFRISGGNAVRCFDVLPGASLDLRDLEVFDGQAMFGGGIYAAQATVILSRVQFASNAATDHGGAISMQDAQLTAVGCAFTACTAAQGGAINVVRTETEIQRSSFYLNTAGVSDGGGLRAIGSYVTLVNTTFDSNTAMSGAGGAMRLASDVAPFDSDIAVISCTVTNNMAGIGGGIHATEPGDDMFVRISQSIVATNTAPAGRDLFFGIGVNATGTKSVIGVGDAGGVIPDGGSNQVGTGAAPLDPLLEAAAFHSGGRVMREPMPLSPAVGAIAPGDCFGASGLLLLDQRTQVRNPATPCDIGAIEI
ncbi:MAG: hypothetical protein QNJ98_14885 [Planctomycetota bacterium]|nr:hypothetical protein [Planctomycetota bacterium]